MLVAFRNNPALLAMFQPQMELQTHKLAWSLYIDTKAYGLAQQHLQAIERLAGAEWWLHTDTSWRERMYYGELAEGLGQLESAQQFYAEAISMVEQQRSALLQNELRVAWGGHADIQRLYFAAARSALKRAAQLDSTSAEAQRYRQKAFTYNEQSRARSLVEQMALGELIAAAPPEAREAMRRWRQLSGAGYDQSRPGRSCAAQHTDMGGYFRGRKRA